MTKILYIHSLSHMGGGETTLYTFLSQLDKNRFKPVLLLPQWGPLAEELSKKGISVYNFPFPRGILNRYPPGFSPGSFIKMLSLVKDLEIDCIHVNDSYLMLYAGLLSKWIGVPVILTSHGWWDAHFLHQDFLNQLFATKICCVSEVVRKSICRRNITNKNKVLVTYLGIDTERFKPISLEKRRKQRSMKE